MKTLIIYYTRTGTTRRVAEELKTKLNADLEEIIDQKDRQGVVGYIKGGKDAYQKNLTLIAEPKSDPSAYDLVVVGTPVWAGLMTPAVRTWLDRYKGRIKSLACFTTQGGAARQKVFDDLSAFTGLPLKAECFFRTREVVKGEHGARLEELIRKLV
jgi:flavodoxin